MTASATSRLPGREHLLSRLASALRREYALFLLATGAVALHFADDNFLQPKPGTSASEHLASGLVPVAVLAAVAAISAHLRHLRAPCRHLHLRSFPLYGRQPDHD